MIDLNLRNKILLLGIISALVPALTTTILVFREEHAVNHQMQKAIDAYSGNLIDRSADDAYSTLELSDSLIQRHLDYSLKMAHAFLAQSGPITFAAPNVSWNAIEPVTQKTTPLSLRRLLVGTNWIQPNTDSKTPTPLVDTIAETTGSVFTIFQRINEAGDMLRVATTIRDKEGRRITGTILPATSPDGNANPVIASILSGKDYHGQTFAGNIWHMTAYEPIRNAAGEVIGMLSVGMRQDAIPDMRRILAATQVGKTGSIYILYGPDLKQGELRSFEGTCIISKNGKYDGQNFLGQRDANGHDYTRAILDDAVKLKPYDNGATQIPLRDPNTGKIHTELIQYQYFKPWNWVVIARAPESDFATARDEVRHELRNLLYWSLVGGAFGLIAAIWLASYIARRIASPISRVTEIAGKIADGNLIEAGQMAGAETCPLSSKEEKNGKLSVPERFARMRDETGRLFCATRTMINNLYSLISQVKNASIQLISTATQISATSRQQESTVQNFGTSTSEIAAAVKEISATSQELLKTMDDVTVVASRTGTQASSAHASIGDMEEAMRKLAQSTTSISAKLSVINEKANNIGGVITTITKVADQTNLLSLNAAIEAEKAGEYGLGFSVVAREIRRLADQTAVATLDIEQMIREMQTSVSTGVMEMDKFSEEVRHGVQEASRLGQDFGKIIDQVQTLTPRFEAVHEGMQAQSQGAQQINDAMLQLTEAARLSAVSIREFNLAADQLHRAVQGLKEEITRFKVA